MPEVQEQQREGGEGGEGKQVKGAHRRGAMRIAAAGFVRYELRLHQVVTCRVRFQMFTLLAILIPEACTRERRILAKAIYLGGGPVIDRPILYRA